MNETDPIASCEMKVRRVPSGVVVYLFAPGEPVMAAYLSLENAQRLSSRLDEALATPADEIEP